MFTIGGHLTFAPGSAVLRDEAKAELLRVAKLLKGRRNYVCKHKLEGGYPPDDEEALLPLGTVEALDFGADAVIAPMINTIEDARRLALVDHLAAVHAGARSDVHHVVRLADRVLIVLDDPDDPTPYWLVSTRRPAELLAALGVDDAAADRPAPTA